LLCTWRILSRTCHRDLIIEYKSNELLADEKKIMVLAKNSRKMG
jgi:hypothetical protein